MASIGELFVELGFDVDSKKLEGFNDLVKSAETGLFKLAAGATGTVAAINAFMESAGERAVGLRQFTQETGYSAQALQQWALAINLASNGAVGIDQATNAYKKFAQTLIDIRQGRGDSGALAILGVQWNPNMTPDQALAEISAHIQQTIAQYGVGMTTQLLERAGIGAGAINALKLSEGQRSQLTGGLSATPEEIANLNKYEATITRIGRIWDKFKTDTAADWSEPLIHGFTIADSWLRDFGKSIDAIINKWKSWSPLIRDVSAALLAALAIWVVPLGGTLAVVTAIAAAIWDIGRAIRGLPSVTGTALDIEGKGLSLLRHNPKQFLDNLFGVLDDLAGVDKNRPDVHWFGSGPRYSPSTDPASLLNKNLSFMDLLNGKTNGGASVTNNVTQNIHTTADATTTAEEAIRLLQQQNNASYQQLDLGPAH